MTGIRALFVVGVLGGAAAVQAGVDDDFNDLSAWTVIPADNWTVRQDGDRTVVAHGKQPGGTVIQKSADTGGLVTLEPIDLATEPMHASVTFRFTMPEQVLGLTFGPGSATGGEGSVSRMHLFVRQNGNMELQVHATGPAGETTVLSKQAPQRFPTDAFVTVSVIRTPEGAWTVKRDDVPDKPVMTEEKESGPVTGSVRFIEIRGTPDADAPFLVDRFQLSSEPPSTAPAP